MLKNPITYFILLSLSLATCGTGNIPAGTEKSDINWHDNAKMLNLWVLADIQPKNRGHRESFELAVADVNENIKNIDFAIVAGDIVNETTEEVFNWYVDTRNRSYIGQWYEIIGNHDLKTDMGKLFKEKLREDVNYSFVKGNILFIFMSDSQRGKATVISDEVFKWWKQLVVENQDKIIVVTTHAPLEDSGIPFSRYDTRQVTDSKRFTDVLEEYRVDLWFSGHLHLPHSFGNTIVKREHYNDVVFVHVSSIRQEIIGLKDSESRVVTFVCGSDKARIRSRNHDRSGYVETLERVVTLSKEYKCE